MSNAGSQAPECSRGSFRAEHRVQVLPELLLKERDAQAIVGSVRDGLYWTPNPVAVGLDISGGQSTYGMSSRAPQSLLVCKSRSFPRVCTGRRRKPLGAQKSLVPASPMTPGPQGIEAPFPGPSSQENEDTHVIRLLGGLP